MRMSRMGRHHRIVLRLRWWWSSVRIPNRMPGKIARRQSIRLSSACDHPRSEGAIVHYRPLRLWVRRLTSDLVVILGERHRTLIVVRARRGIDVVSCVGRPGVGHGLGVGFGMFLPALRKGNARRGQLGLAFFVCRGGESVSLTFLQGWYGSSFLNPVL